MTIASTAYAVPAAAPAELRFMSRLTTYLRTWLRTREQDRILAHVDPRLMADAGLVLRADVNRAWGANGDFRALR